jgi:hypothetical protein
MSKYSLLQVFLESSKKPTETLSFQQVEDILGFSLPDSASKHRPWWANGGHSQADAWLDAGWQVESVSLGISVTFRKTNIDHIKSVLPLPPRPPIPPEPPQYLHPEEVSLTPDGASRNTPPIVLISCVSMKLKHKAKAEDLYISPLFIKSLAFAKIINPKKIFILSAEHHLLKLNTEIEPYNKTLNDMNDTENRMWAKSVLEQIKNECDIVNDRFIIFAGRNYYKHIISSLRHYEIPMSGLAFGERLRWLNIQIEKSVMGEPYER